jgi:hypothetical protein
MAKKPSPVRKLIEAALGALIVMMVGLTVKEFGFSIARSFATAAPRPPYRHKQRRRSSERRSRTSVWRSSNAFRPVNKPITEP